MNEDGTVTITLGTQQAKMICFLLSSCGYDKNVPDGIVESMADLLSELRGFSDEQFAMWESLGQPGYQVTRIK
jgi:hypothetical protein